VLAVKERLEKDFRDKALEAVPKLSSKTARCVVFLENRNELAKNPKAKPEYVAYVRIDTSDKVPRDDLGKIREAISQATSLPLESVGIVVQAKRRLESYGEGISPRLADLYD
jgi:hypothetical protein